MKLCQALTRGGGLCKKQAGWGTAHVGSGKCRLHGGATPIKHGRYSGIEREDLRDAVKRFESDPDPLNLLPEVALLRATLEDLCNRWNEIYGPDGALLAWHESFGSENSNPKPRQLPDFSSISSVADRVGAMVDRIQKHKAQQSITLATLNRVIEQLGIETVAALRETVLDESLRTAVLESIEQRWSTIKLESSAASDSRAKASAGQG